MTFRRRDRFPGLPPQAVSELTSLQDDLMAEFSRLRAEAIGQTTDTKQSGTYGVRFNERVRCLPLASGVDLTFPGATSQTQNRWIEVLKLGGGDVRIRATSGEVQGGSVATLTTDGFYYWQSDGAGGWWVQPSGGTLAATLALGNTTGGLDINLTAASELQIAGNPGVLGQVLTSQGAGASPIWAPAGGGGSLTLLTAEVSLGSVPTWGGTFAIAGAGMTPGKAVLIQQAVGPYTGKGTLADEAEDQVTVAASVTSATVITAYWQAVASPLVGNVRFNYAVSA